jgi:hypothetical protein
MSGLQPSLKNDKKQHNIKVLSTESVCVVWCALSGVRCLVCVVYCARSNSTKNK